MSDPTYTMETVATNETAARYIDIDAKAMLRTVDPLFRSRPLYIMTKTLANYRMLPGDYPHAWGWAGNNLSNQCRQYLEETKQWQGPGFAMIYNHRVCSLRDPAFFGTVCHEAGHWAGWTITTTEDSHGPTWLRATLHCWWRALVNGYSIQLADVMDTAKYGLSPTSKYVDTLMIEASSCDQEPIETILKTPAPPAFQALYDRDTGQTPMKPQTRPRQAKQQRLIQRQPQQNQSGRRVLHRMWLASDVLTTYSDGTATHGERLVTDEEVRAIARRSPQQASRVELGRSMEIMM